MGLGLMSIVMLLTKDRAYWVDLVMFKANKIFFKIGSVGIKKCSQTYKSWKSWELRLLFD